MWLMKECSFLEYIFLHKYIVEQYFSYQGPAGNLYGSTKNTDLWQVAMF